MAKKAAEELQKAMEEALAEARAARADAEAARAELEALKGKKADGAAKSQELVPVPTVQPVRPRGPFNYPQLTRTNYTLWAMQMRVALQSAGVWAAVSSETVSFEEDRDALLAIYQAVPEDVLASLAGKDTAKMAWEAIKAMNIGHDRVRETKLQTLRKAFEALEMEDTESVETFATRVNKMVASIRALGDELKELTVVQKILQAAPARFMHLVTSLEQCIDLKTLTVEDLFGRFQAHEERVRMRFGDPVGGPHLLLSKKQWRSYQSGKGDRGAVRGHGSRRNDDSSDSDTSVRSGRKAGKKGKCYNCGVRGHYSSECRKPKKEEAFFASADEHPALL